MADLTLSGSYNAVIDPVLGNTKLGANKKNANGDTNGIAGITRIVTLSKSSISDAEIQSVLDAMQAGGVKGTDDAVVVVGLEKATNVATVAVQGSGVLTAGADYRGVTGVTMAIAHTFPGISG